MELTVKQTKALDILEDEVTTELYYGGAAGGGKSAIGCYWQLKRRLRYPGTRGFLGRSELKNLKKTTLKTFFEVCAIQGVKPGVHIHYNQQESVINFANGSEILLGDLYHYPSDPNFDSLGSLELTDAFIDEAPQVSELGKNTLKSRIRFKLEAFCNICGDAAKKHIIVRDDSGKPILWICNNGHKTSGLVPKLLMAGNPSKGWAYNQFYKPAKQGVLRPDRQFVQALPGDNPHLPASYLDSLRGLDENSKQRLLYGNWEYDDDPTALISYDKILDCFTNSYVSHGEKYITVDVARYGSDNTVIGVWDGWRVKFHVYHGKSIPEVADLVKIHQQINAVPNSNTIVDDDGVGGGVVDILKCKGFVNNSRALPNPVAPLRDNNGNSLPDNYANLKSQCYYGLAEAVNDGLVFIECEDVGHRAQIIQEMEQVKMWNMDKDGKKQIIPKEKVKEAIGRSPDFSDTMAMRKWFELTPKFVASF